MKHELQHFQIGDSYGGNQDWFPTPMMRGGGCGAETACDSSLYFALHRGLSKLAPENAATLTQDDYVRFIGGDSRDCPFWRGGDDYATARKQ